MINYYAIFTVVKFRIREFLFEYHYSILAPLTSNLIFLIIFSTIDRFYNLSDGNISFMQFLIPGLIIMIVAQESFDNPSVSIINISDYLSKVTDVLNKVFIAVSIISTITVVIGLVVISSAIIVQGKIKTFQNLVFKILGFTRKEIIFSSIMEFIINFISIILFSTLFAVIASKYVIENIFQLKWEFDLVLFMNFSLLLTNNLENFI